MYIHTHPRPHETDRQTQRINGLTLRLLMSYIYGAPILDVSISHTGRSPAEIVGSNPTGGMDICLL